jgi:hypothetical protein
MEKAQAVERLKSIQSEMIKLADEALELVTDVGGRKAENRAKSYWYAHIMGWVDGDSPYGNRYELNLTKVIEELERDEQEDDE